MLATTLDLPATVGTTLAAGTYLNAATATEPVAVLGASAASRLGIDRLYPGERIWAGQQWFYVVGILKPAVLAPEIDAAMLVGFPAAKTYLGFDGHPSTIYLRANTDQVAAVQAVLAATADPEAPNQVNVSQPSAALVARAETKSALNGLFLGLGAVALLVGAIGVANIMVISVLERRSEIGLRRALGATKGHIRTQFLSEAIVLAVIGGAVGVASARLRPRFMRIPKAGQSSSRPSLGVADSGPHLSSGPSPDCYPHCVLPACPRPARSGACETSLAAVSSNEASKRTRLEHGDLARREPYPTASLKLLERCVHALAR